MPDKVTQSHTPSHCHTGLDPVSKAIKRMLKQVQHDRILQSHPEFIGLSMPSALDLIKLRTLDQEASTSFQPATTTY